MPPNDLGGRLCLNCARTTPELPVPNVSPGSLLHYTPRVLGLHRTVWPRDLAPDHPNLRPPDLFRATVHICDLLAQVEVRGLRVVNPLDLDERGVRVRVALAALVTEVATPAQKIRVSMLPYLLRPCARQLCCIADCGPGELRRADSLHVESVAGSCVRRRHCGRCDASVSTDTGEVRGPAC